MPRIPDRLAILLCSWCLLPLLAGCTGFENDWKAAAGRAGASEDPLVGRWEGTWKSEGSGHSGGLRCVVSREAEGQYTAVYHATFWNVLQYAYDMKLQAEPAPDEPDGLMFRGGADLGWLAGGKYRYEGHVDRETFWCLYGTASDHGYFLMKRPKADVAATASTMATRTAAAATTTTTTAGETSIDRSSR